MKRGIIMIIICALSFCTQPAQAVPITIEITGEVTDFSYYRGPVIDIPVGSVFTGTYTYDSATSDSRTSPYVGEYYHNSPYGFNISLGGLEFKTVPSHIGSFVIDLLDNVIDGGGIIDVYYVASYGNSPLPNGALYGIYWRLVDSTHTALSSDALSVVAPVLSDWDRNSFQIGSGNSWGIEGVVTETVLVPEPLTGVLIMMGVLLLRRR